MKKITALIMMALIITIGGVHGRVESFDQKHMYILTDDQGTVLKFERVALKEVVK